LRFTREKTGHSAHLILKPWKRGGLEDFSRTKEDEMTTATFDHQVGKSLEFFEQQRNEKTACGRFIGALYFEAGTNRGTNRGQSSGRKASTEPVEEFPKD
jgi:hypothetical protein